MPTPTTTLRLRAQLRAEIDRLAKRSRRSFSEVAQALLEEGVRMQECPGIYFADEPAGREPKIAGTGLGVWEVIRDYKALRGDRRKVLRAFPHLSAAGVQAALTYYGRYSEDIDEAIADNAAAYEAGKVMQAKAARRA